MDDDWGLNDLEKNVWTHQNDKVTKKTLVAHTEEEWTSQFCEITRLQVGWHIQKTIDEKSPFAIKQAVSANWLGDTSTVMLW